MSSQKTALKVRADLSEYTTLKIGPVIRDFYVVNNENELKALSFRFRGRFYLLGCGSNLLVSDSGLSRPVLKLGPGFSFCRAIGTDNLVEVGAGTRLANFLKFCIELGLSGIESHCGIPASIGGLIRMNASCYGNQISDYVRTVEAFDVNQGILSFSGEEISFGYRNSSLADKVILKISLKLKKSKTVKNRLKAFILKRKASQELASANCGCIFKNPEGNSAGYLLDSCNLKGIKRNEAMISLKHANFIVNTGKASYNDVDYLIKLMKDSVYKRYSIILEEEIQRWT